MEEFNCQDCKYYLPVDVFRGLCKLSKEKITPETPCCSKAEKVPKCRFCMNFIPGKEHLGKCMGTTLAYPDMTAVKCADFQWYTKN